MTPEQIILVNESFDLVQPMAQAAASVFYDRLFYLDPGLRRLFPDDLTEQKLKLMAALGLAVRGLSQPETLIPPVRDLGRRHAGYGVRPQDYQTVGAALLWTLERGLGDAFTPALQEAWTAAYTLLATTMQAGAAPPDGAEVADAA